MGFTSQPNVYPSASELILKHTGEIRQCAMSLSQRIRRCLFEVKKAAIWENYIFLNSNETPQEHVQ